MPLSDCIPVLHRVSFLRQPSPSQAEDRRMRIGLQGRMLREVSGAALSIRPGPTAPQISWTTTLLACAALALAGCTQAPAPVPAQAPIDERTDPYAGAQRYWNVAAPRIGTSIGANPSAEACVAHLGQMLALREPETAPGAVRGAVYERPELMALGDSLYNGVQSMRINWWLAEWSAPALVAIRLGLIEEIRADRTGQRRFFVPQYPTQGAGPSGTQDYGFSFENIPGIPGLLGTPRRQGQALDHLAFHYVPPNQRTMVENIAFSGANSHDLLYWSADEHTERARHYIDRATGGLPLQQFGALGSAFFHANAAFVLNPMRDPCIGRLTPVQHVELRRPRRLLLNIGPNDGLWLLAFRNPNVQQDACSGYETVTRGVQNGLLRCAGAGVSIQTSMMDVYTANITSLLDRLSRIDGLQEVFLNGLPVPSQTANLVPERRGSEVVWYSDVMSGRSGRVFFTSDQVRTADRLVSDVNLRVRQIVDRANATPGGPRVVWVDNSAALGRYDSKRCVADNTDSQTVADCMRGKQMVLTRERFGVDAALDNRPVRFQGESGVRTGSGFESNIVEGGIFSFDNMHLSSVGYEILAYTVFRAMGSVPEAPRNACLEPNQPGYDRLRPGDCAALLVTPGWAYADATRRQFVFLRRAGLEETENRLRLSARIAFLNRLMQ